ncbi:hypothetical protein MKW92_014180 [Papaver armeniacum]|nr:hypothetical protein MKW92_014180 [Papaver armeniacum]
MCLLCVLQDSYDLDSHYIWFRRQKLMVPWYWYLLLGFIDVQANFLVIKAYQYSSIMSVTLLDCWTTPWVMILTWIFIGTRYSLCQFFGAAMCVVGLCLVLLSDSAGGGSAPLLGDALVIAGTLGYALSNVGEEFCVKKTDLMELLTMLGIFEMIVIGRICAIQTLNYESDVWVPIIYVFVYQQSILWLYYLSFVVLPPCSDGPRSCCKLLFQYDLHQSQSERRGKNIHPHRLGRTSYAWSIKKWYMFIYVKFH